MANLPAGVSDYPSVPERPPNASCPILKDFFFFLFFYQTGHHLQPIDSRLLRNESLLDRCLVSLFFLTLLLPICIHIWDGTSRLLRGSRLFTDSPGNIRNMCWLPVVVVVVVERKGYMKGAPLCLYPPPPKTKQKPLHVCFGFLTIVSRWNKAEAASRGFSSRWQRAEAKGTGHEQSLKSPSSKCQIPFLSTLLKPSALLSLPLVYSHNRGPAIFSPDITCVFCWVSIAQDQRSSEWTSKSRSSFLLILLYQRITIHVPKKVPKNSHLQSKLNNMR